MRVLSSNYPLIGDMSRRMMHCLAAIAPEIEIYSVDEAFLDLHGMERYFGDLAVYGQTIRATVRQRVRIPICVGIAPTKTLAKLANRLAKKTPSLNGVCYLDSPARCAWAREQTPVEDVWGVGYQYAVRLHAAGVHTAADLARCSEPWVRRHLGGVVGVRLVRELQGTPCQGMLPSEDGTLARQRIAHTLLFGSPLSDFADLSGAVSAFTSHAAEKLRRQGSAASTLTVFLSKKRYGTQPPPYTFSTVVTLPDATSDTADLLRHARAVLKRLWRASTVYKKAGVILDGLETAGQQQLNLFASTNDGEVRTKLMADIDALNRRYGAGTVGFAAALAVQGSLRAPWLGKAEFRSAAYTTNWNELWSIA